MSIEAISAVFEHSKTGASGHGLLVLVALADCANPKDGNVAYPSLEKLARKVRLSKSRLCKVLNKLESIGELIRHKSTGGKNRRSRYVITCLNGVTGNSVTGNTVAGNSVTDDMQTVSPVGQAKNRNRNVSSKRRSKAAPATPPNPAVKEFKDFWAERYRNRFGCEYLFDHGKDGKHIRDMLSSFDLPSLKLKAEQFFDGDDEWTQTKGGFTIGVFRTQINRLNSIRGKQTRKEPKFVNV